MDGIELIGYLGAALMGISLGMIGSGGSILTVPILVYLIQIEPVLATAYSLFTVGITALAGGLNFARQDLVDYQVGVVFAIPAFIAVYFTRLWIVPALPDRSEEHTSELQSRGHLVCRLLLEKKKKRSKTIEQIGTEAS